MRRCGVAFVIERAWSRALQPHLTSWITHGYPQDYAHGHSASGVMRAVARWLSSTAQAGAHQLPSGIRLTAALEHRLESIAKRCQHLEQVMAVQPGTRADAQAHDTSFKSIAEDPEGTSRHLPQVIPSMASMQREYGSLLAITQQWLTLCGLRKELLDVEALTHESDVEMVQEARKEQTKLQIEARRLEEQLLLSLLPKQAGDENRGAIVEVRAGAGGAEASLFASELLGMYAAWASRKGWDCEVLETSPSDAGGVKTGSMAVSGAGSYQQLRWEAGVHRVQRVPVTETSGRLHTSTASVVVLPEVDEVELTIHDADIQVDTYRSSGPGGQSVNTTATAVRVTHIPTGIVAMCQDERSQIRNKAKAMRILRSRVMETERRKAVESTSAERKAQAGTAERNERIRTYNFGQDRLTDHRVSITHQGLTDIMTGHDVDALDRIHSALAFSEQERLLGQLLEEQEHNN